MFAKAFGAVSAAATSAASAASAAVKDGLDTISCPGGCGTTCKKVLEATKFKSSCVTCSKRFCDKCIVELKNTHDSQLTLGGAASATPSDGKFEGKWVCSAHKDELFRFLKEKYCESNQIEVRKGTQAYLDNDEKQTRVFEFVEVKAGSREKLSLAKDLIIGTTYGIASVLGIKDVAKFAYSAYMAGGVYNLIMDPALYAIMQPIVQRMEEDAALERKAAGVEEVKKTKSEAAQEFMNQVVYLYYLSLTHVQNNIQEIAGISSAPAAEGVINARCPVELIDVLGEYMGAAKWLYFSLGSIHREESMMWYLAQITWSEGWTILSATNKSIKFVDGQMNPAFCVAARNSPTKGGKEVLVTVRGSSEQTDWWINASEFPQKMVFEGVEGHIHGGMYAGVLAILDNFGARTQVMEFVRLGYKVTVVGHSLGAGTAMILAMELLNHMRKSGISNAEKLIKSIAYACPAVVTENLADKVAQLGWITAVYGNDVVPRISHGNIKKLTDELKNFTPTAAQWFDADYKALKDNLASYGERVLTQNLVADTTTTTAAEAAQQTAAGERPQDEKQQEQIPISKEIAVSMGVLLVPPGRIVHITKKNSSVGGYQAAEISHRNPCLRTITLITDQMVDDHLLDNYFTAIRGTRFSPVYASSPQPAPVSAVVNPTKPPDFTKPVNCGICNLDTTWPCRTHNASSRFDYTHYCVLCRRTVCVVCAPASDSVPEEGLSRDYKQLPDLRMPILSKGIPKTQRVCIACYLNSYQML